tara:strand:- start:331352 stop:332266 length:915 start_codon:yes stop_codon:yes gene_type:complete
MGQKTINRAPNNTPNNTPSDIEATPHHLGQKKSGLNRLCALERQRSLDQFAQDFEAAPIHSPSLSSLIQAFHQDEVYYAAEPWVNAQKDIIANELLFRFKRGEDSAIGNYTYIEDDLRKSGLLTDFDILNIFNILSWLPQDTQRIHSTINLSHDTLCDSELCEQLFSVLQHKEAPSLIIEILEDDKQFNAQQIAYLSDLRKRGTIFAMDDFRINIQSDWARLQSLKSQDILSYIKLDGKQSVRPYLDQGKPGLEALRAEIIKIKSHAGCAPQIIAEWVNNEQEIDQLVSIGVDAVQGTNLILTP